METIDQNQVSSWFDVESVPSSYIFPPTARPGKNPVPTCQTIPVIDLGKSKGPERTHTVDQILKSGQEFGFFQVMNHGVSENIVIETMNVFKEFFQMPAADRDGFRSRNGLIYLSSKDYDKDGVYLWRDNIKHLCHPLEDCMPHWPETPTRYREVVARYLVEVRELSQRILELISEGLGLEKGYLEELSQLQLLSANNYPPCPDPSLTLGILKHSDPSLITILLQGDVCGLQVLKDGQWIGVGALPTAFVVNIGNQLETISNGKLRSSEHRAVTNSKETRTTIAAFINPSPYCIVEPAKVLVNESNPPLYKPSLYNDFVHKSTAFGPYTEKIENLLS